MQSKLNQQKQALAELEGDLRTALNATLANPDGADGGGSGADGESLNIPPIAL